MNKFFYLLFGMLIAVGCGATSSLLWQPGFIVPSNGLGHECDDGPLNWGGGQGDCLFTGALSNNPNSDSQRLSFLACPPGLTGCSSNGYIKASIYEDANGNLIVKLPVGGTIQVVH